MDLSNIQSFKLLQEKMKYHVKRQEVISENFANATTPGYYRKEVIKPDFNAMVGQASKDVRLATTNPNHINPNASRGDANIFTTDVRVKLDMESIQMSQNQSEFAQAAATYKKMLSLVREAIRAGQ